MHRRDTPLLPLLLLPTNSSRSLSLGELALTVGIRLNVCECEEKTKNKKKTVPDCLVGSYIKGQSWQHINFDTPATCTPSEAVFISSKGLELVS